MKDHTFYRHLEKISTYDPGPNIDYFAANSAQGRVNQQIRDYSSKNNLGLIAGLAGTFLAKKLGLGGMIAPMIGASAAYYAKKKLGTKLKSRTLGV